MFCKTCWIYILQSVIAWVWKWGREREGDRITSVSRREGGSNVSLFLCQALKTGSDWCQIFWAGLQPASPPRDGQIAELWLPCSESGSLVKTWLELEVGNTIGFFHDSDASFFPSSANVVPGQMKLIGEGVPGNSGKLGWSWMDYLGLSMFRLGPVPQWNQCPATLGEISVLKDIWTSWLLTLDSGFKKILPL